MCFCAHHAANALVAIDTYVSLAQVSGVMSEVNMLVKERCSPRAVVSDHWLRANGMALILVFILQLDLGAYLLHRGATWRR